MVYIQGRYLCLIKWILGLICEFDVHTSLSSLKQANSIFVPLMGIEKDAFWNKIQGCNTELLRWMQRMILGGDILIVLSRILWVGKYQMLYIYLENYSLSWMKEYLDLGFGKLYVLMVWCVWDLLTKQRMMKNMQCGNAFHLSKERLKIHGLKKMQILFLQYLHVVCQNHEHPKNIIYVVWYLVLLIKLLKSVFLLTKCYWLTGEIILPDVDAILCRTKKHNVIEPRRNLKNGKMGIRGVPI